MGTTAKDDVKPERISFTEVEDHSWKRGGVAKEPNPYIEDVRALYAFYTENDGKAKTYQAVVPEADADKFIRQLRSAGREVGCTVLIDKSNPDKGKVAVRFTARTKIVKNKGGGGAPTS